MDNKKSKKEILIDQLKDQKNYFRCPFCQSELSLKDNSLVCTNNHTFNINKKGYLYLSTINNLHTSELYNNSLFQARRQVIHSGIYDNIHQEIIKTINTYNQNAQSIIDIGSGEATHLSKITKDKNYNFKLAIDLSKQAISLASDYIYEGLISSISDVENIPLKDNCIDIILDFLSPMSLKECFRVLKENGIIIKVIPTRSYLKEIREV